MFDQFLNHIDKISAVSKTREKLDLLYQIGPLGQKILQYAYDPFKMFGVKNINTNTPHDPESANPDALFALLEDLYNRRKTGGAAIAAIEETIINHGVPAELMWRILNKDMRAGFTAESINKVFPKLIPDFKVALAHEYQGWEGEKLISIKYDGLRCIAMVDESGVVKLRSRNGLPIEAPEVVSAIEAWGWARGKVLDGEIMIEDAHFQESSGSIRGGKTNGRAVYYIFDWLPFEEFISRRSTMNQLERYAALTEANIPGKPLIGVTHQMATDQQMIDQTYEAVRAKGLEGLILKDPMATYQFRRNAAWQKMKDQVEVTCTVTGVLEGKGKYEGMLGKLVVDFGGLPNQIGSGITDQQRAEWWADPDLIIGKQVDLLYHEKTEDGNMRHGRLKSVRFDL